MNWKKKSQPLTHLSYYNKSNSWCRGQNRILLYGVFRTRRILQQPDSHLEDSESTISRCKNKRKKNHNLHFLPTSTVLKNSPDIRMHEPHLQGEIYFNMERWKPPKLKALQRGKIYSLSWHLFWYFTTFMHQAMLPSASHLGQNYMFLLRTVGINLHKILVTPKDISLSGSESIRYLTFATWARWIKETRKFCRPFLFPQLLFQLLLGSSVCFKTLSLILTVQVCSFVHKPLNTSLLQLNIQ